MPYDCSFPMHPQLSRISPGVYKWPRQDFSSKQEPELCGNWMAFCYTETIKSEFWQAQRATWDCRTHWIQMSILSSSFPLGILAALWWLDRAQEMYFLEADPGIKIQWGCYSFLKKNTLWGTSFRLDKKNLHCFLSFSTKITSQNLQMQNSLSLSIISLWLAGVDNSGQKACSPRKCLD